MIVPKICINCNNKFTPKKNDKRIKYCSAKCRKEKRNKEGYNKKWYEENKEKVKEYNKNRLQKKLEWKRDKYKNDPEYREKQKERTKIYRKKNPNVRKNNDLKNMYGITFQEYQDMKKEQGYKCAICGESMQHSSIQFNVDHCHSTEKVRGILCSNCNFGIGHLKDDIEILKSAIKYLRRFQ